MEELIGIYEIRNRLTNRVYVGSSTDITTRLKSHRYELEAGRHSCRALQQDWDQYGESQFEFNILQSIDLNQLLKEEEQSWIEQRGSMVEEGGYNEEPALDRPRPPIHPSELSWDEVLAIRSLAKHVPYRRLGSLYGLTPSVVGKIVRMEIWKDQTDAPLKGSGTNKPKLTREQAESLREDYYKLGVEGCMEKYGVSRTHVSRIIHRHVWK